MEHGDEDYYARICNYRKAAERCYNKLWYDDNEDEVEDEGLDGKESDWYDETENVWHDHRLQEIRNCSFAGHNNWATNCTCVTPKKSNSVLDKILCERQDDWSEDVLPEEGSFNEILDTSKEQLQKIFNKSQSEKQEMKQTVDKSHPPSSQHPTAKSTSLFQRPILDSASSQTLTSAPPSLPTEPTTIPKANSNSLNFDPLKLTNQSVPSFLDQSNLSNHQRDTLERFRKILDIDLQFENSKLKRKFKLSEEFSKLFDTFQNQIDISSTNKKRHIEKNSNLDDLCDQGSLVHQKKRNRVELNSTTPSVQIL